MCDLERGIRRHLVLTLGFSRRNAEIAVEMFRRGELTRPEEEVINRIQLFPDFEKHDLTYYSKSYPVAWVADHLNYRITLAGGDSVTKSNSIDRGCCRRHLEPILTRL